MVIDEIRSEFAKLQDRLQKGPIFPNVTPEEIRNHLASRYSFCGPLDLQTIVADVEQMLANWQVQVTHPRYLGLFNPSVTLSSVIADVLVAFYNPQLASWRTSPAGNEIERFTLDWLASRFGFPQDAIANFTNGGAEANLSAVIAALTHAFPSYGDNGLASLRAAPVIYLSEEAHHSFSKIAHMTGLGRHALRIVATDAQLRLDPQDLARRVVEDRRKGLFPLMVVGTCGTTTAGVIDPLPELGSYCRQEGLWFHVDAAWGGAAIVSPQLRQHLAGIEAADSITCDAHKWFSVPMGCGMFFCRHPETLVQAFRADASYMPGRPTESARDPYTTTVQWSRRFVGLKLFLSLAQHGEAGYAAMIEQQTRMGHRMRECLIGSGWRMVNTTPLPVLCFTRDGLDVPRCLASMREQQIAWVSEARIGGEPVIRACISSFRTTEQDVLWVVDEMNRIFRQQVASPAVGKEC